MVRLCTNQEVRDAAGFGVSDITDGRIGSEIIDVEREMYGHYGNPVKKSFFYLDNRFTLYEFRKNKKETHAVTHVEIFDKSQTNKKRVLTEVSVTPGSFEFKPTLGEGLDASSTVELNSGDVGTFNGNRCEVEYIPIEFNLLCKCKAALNLLDTANVQDGEDVESGQTIKLMGRIKRIADNLKPIVVLGSSKFDDWDPRMGEFICQNHENTL